MHKHIMTILQYNKNQIPPLLWNPLGYYVIGLILMLGVAVIIALVPEYRPGVLWSPASQEAIPSLLSKFVVLFPVTILLRFLNPSGRLLSEFKYHWCGMENITGIQPFRDYTDDVSTKVNSNQMNKLWLYLKDYYTVELNLPILARNQRIFTTLSSTLYWCSVTGIIVSFIYIGYLLGIGWHRNFRVMEYVQSVYLMRHLLWTPVIGIIIQYLLLLFNANDKWMRSSDFNDSDYARGEKYYQRSIKLFNSLELNKE